MKRYMFAIFLLSIFFISGLPLTAHAAETVASGSCGPSLNWILTDDGTLTISGYGAMNKFGTQTDGSASKSAPWYQYRNQISSLVFEEGITSISHSAFYSSYNITSLKLANSITKIDTYAFTGSLDELTYLKLPDNLQTIGNMCFGTMPNMVSITIPESVTSIGTYGFSGMSKLVSVVCLSDVPPSLGSNAFNSSVLTRIMVPEGTVDAYKAASGWSSYAGFITDGLPDPNAFTVLTSWADQHIYLDSGEQVNLYFIADGVNGSVSVDWYVNGELFKSFTADNWLDNDTVIDAYYFDPGTDGTRTVYAVVHNTIGSNTESVTTPSCTIIHGQGTGSGSTDSDRLDQIDVELTEVKDAIGDVSDKVDGLSDAVEQLPGQITDGMQQIQEDERNQADSEGQAAVDQIIDVIPDDSENFAFALGSLVNLLSYEGTSAVITMPAMTIPAVSNLFPEITLLEEQHIDFEIYIQMIPQWLIVLCWAFFDAAIVLYCIRELLGLIGGFANGFQNIGHGWGALDE